MQKLQEEFKNIPVGASLACSSISVGLNRDVNTCLSVPGKVLTCNNPEVNLSQQTGRLKVVVFVLAEEGHSLMPCSCAKASKLLKAGKARVIRRDPFTIQLNWVCENQVQEVTLGIDPGYQNIGFSAVTEKKELISGEVVLRKDVSDKLSERRMYRRNKRNRLWYRKPRFLNRISTKKDGWLSPSLKHKLDSHIRLIDRIKSLLPVSKIIIEVASFDPQRMENPEISGAEYQQGELQGYEVKEYLLKKYAHRCVYCGKKDIPLEVEHIVPKSRGGTNRISNLTIACTRCNLKKGNKTAEEFGYPGIQSQTKIGLKAETFMSLIRHKLVGALEAGVTYGYVTKFNRSKLDLIKTHTNDAFVIAGGTDQIRSEPIYFQQKRRNNRALQLNRKGFKPSIRRQHYAIQPYDILMIGGKKYIAKGIHSYGKAVICLDFMGKKFDFSTKKVEDVFHVGGLFRKEIAPPPTTKVVGFRR